MIPRPQRSILKEHNMKKAATRKRDGEWDGRNRCMAIDETADSLVKPPYRSGGSL
jgi:hypothetical protein